MDRLLTSCSVSQTPSHMTSICKESEQQTNDRKDPLVMRRASLNSRASRFVDANATTLLLRLPIRVHPWKKNADTLAAFLSFPVPRATEDHSLVTVLAQASSRERERRKEGEKADDCFLHWIPLLSGSREAFLSETHSGS